MCMNRTVKYPQFTKLASAFACILLVASCTTKIAYNYLDWILEWYVSDLVTLNDDQEWKLSQAINQELLWHRQTQLPRYADSLEQLHNDINNGLDFDSLKRFYRSNENAWTTLKLHATPSVSRLFKTLNDSQVDQLMENLEQQNRDLEEDYVNKTAQERQQQRSERMIERIEDWTGDLNAQQKTLVENWSRQVRPLSRQWIATRRAWQASLEQILHEQRDNPQFDKQVHELFYNSRKFWPDWYHDAFYDNVYLTLHMFADISKQFTPQQKQHLLDALQQLRGNLQELQTKQ